MEAPQVRQIQFKVVGQDPLSAQAPVFSNFVAISHVGREVQIEFVFVDINEVARELEKGGPEPAMELPLYHGKTVAKVVVPSWAFVQLKDHVMGVFEKIEAEEKGRQGDTGERAYGG